MTSKRQQEIEARKAADPIAQFMEREDIDYGSDELPTAPRSQVNEGQNSAIQSSESGKQEVEGL